MGDRQSLRAIQWCLGLGVAATVAACGSQPAPPPLTQTPPPAPTPIAVPASPTTPPTEDPALLPEGGKQGEGSAN